MKVVLLKDVARIGKRFEVATVPDGYALNKLIPQGQAEPATPENMKRVNAMAVKAESERAADDAAFTTAIEALKEKTITVKADANEQGHLFQGLKAEDIATAAQADGIEISAAHVSLEAPLKEVGDHSIQIASGEQTATVTVTVVST